MDTKPVELTTGKGGLPLVKIHTPWSVAEIYLHGAHVTHFQKNGEPPLLFLSARSHFAAGQPIRGGVPICFPWFGNRVGGPSHGFARISEWQLVRTAVAPDGAVMLAFALPQIPERDAWNNLRTEFIVTVADTLTMELVATNESADKTLEIENCLHTYLHVGDIGAISLAGLQGAPFDDFAAGAGGARKRPPVLFIYFLSPHLRRVSDWVNDTREALMSGRMIPIIILDNSSFCWVADWCYRILVLICIQIFFIKLSAQIKSHLSSFIIFISRF